ncbi:Transcriptional regulator, AbrB family [Crenothrix polyspora]|uniref:Transcriptional regulator, AbrB family n=1 Tax=Crenothrix polyspora TaxID=360316 RepID=A0A1R4HBI9_9GAMM|nr:AbrB/MazE/SpoVT family DNA-binding domain-containing protein [Crenothrix polyspora]SJM93618.1 Transcriptional regulator, AbrB family [Crenothrix polyspora]
MPIATLRPKGQITIPVNILKAWGININEQVEVNIHNGVVTLIPLKRKETPVRKDIMDFVGIGRGMWGETAEEVDASIKELRDSWTR